MLKLYVIEGPMKGHSFDLKKEAIFLGRSSDNDIQIKDETVSRRHLKIFTIGKMLFVEDLKSANGTFINHELIVPGKGFEVGEEDVIAIGNTVIGFSKKPSFKAEVIHPSKEKRPEDEALPKERRSQTLHNLTLICSVSELLKRLLTIDEMLGKLLGYLLATLPRIDRTAILQFDNQKMKITGLTTRSRQAQAEKSSRYSRTVVARVLRYGEAVKMPNAAYEMPDYFSRDVDSSNIRSVLCVPMSIKSRTCGAIYMDSLRGPYGFRGEDVLLLRSLSGPVAVAIENARLASRLEELHAG